MRLFLLAFALSFAVAAPSKKTTSNQPKNTKSVSVKKDRSPVGEIKFTVLMKDLRSSSEVADQLRQMESLRSTAEESLRKLLRGKESDLELNLRLAELRLQRARDFEQFSLEFSLGGNEAKSKELSQLSHNLYEKGLAHYRQLLPRVGKHPQEGEIYLGMARSLRSVGKNREALALLKDLGDRSFHRKTNFFLALTRGDLEFSLANAAGAKAAYDQASQYVTKDSPEEMYLLYKQAWALYNLKDPEQALSLLKRVIEANRDKLALAQEAVQDYALFVADLPEEQLKRDEGGIAGVYRYLSRHSRGDVAERALEKLSETYSLNGRRNEAKESLEFLIELNPFSLRNGERALTIVKLDHDIVNTKALPDRYFWLIKNFGPLSTWYKKQSLRPDIQRNTYDSIEESLRTFSVGLHKEANSENSESRRRDLEETVAKLYDAHIENFKEIPRIHYYRAEIYRRLKDFENAARHYDSFIVNLEGYEENKLEEFDTKVKREAAYASVEMWAKAIDKKPKLVELMLKACDKFVELFPKDEKAPTVALDAARVEYKSGSPEIALKRIQKLVESFPKSPESVEAVNAGLDILNKQGDFVNLAEYARSWREKLPAWAPEQKKEDLRGELDRVLSTSEAKSCEELAKRKNKKLEAALCFRRVADVNTDSDVAPKALVLASDLFKEFGDPFSSLDALDALIKNHPNSPQAVVAFSKLAEGFERTFQFARSAEVYEQLLTRKDVPNRKQVVHRLASLYTGLGETEKLDRTLKDKEAGPELKSELFSKQLKSDHDELLNLERQKGYVKGRLTDDRAQSLYLEFKELEKKSKLPIHLSLELQRIEGHFLHSLGNLQKADEVWMAGLKRFWKTSPKNPDLWESAARMRLSQGSYWRSLFKSAELATNPQKKVSLFQKLETWNTEVLGMNSPAVALETLWATAKIYSEFGEELKASPETKKMGDDMENRSKIVIQELARRAQNWGLITPLLLSSLKEIRSHRGEKSEDVSINFPWPELPRGLAMSAESANSEDWRKSPSDLQRALTRTKDRRTQRRMAYILLTKENSLRSSKLNGWEELLTGRDEVQARIDAAMADGQVEKAEMLVSQYEAVHGEDVFSAITRSQMDIKRRDYSSGYRRALALFAQNSFEAKYYAIGWKSLFDELIDGELSESFRIEAFQVLDSLAKQDWQKKLVATLCLRGTLKCQGDYLGVGIIPLLVTTKPESMSDYIDHRSLWRIERDFLELALKSLSKIVTKQEHLAALRTGLLNLKQLSRGSLDSKSHRQSVELVRRDVEALEDRIRNQMEAARKPAQQGG